MDRAASRDLADRDARQAATPHGRAIAQRSASQWPSSACWPSARTLPFLRTQQAAGGSTSVISTSAAHFARLPTFARAPSLRRLKAHRGVQRSPLELLGASLLIVGVNAGFTISLLKVNTAKALLLISLNPLWAALMGKVLLNDPLPTRTILAQGLALCATILVFMPALPTIFGPATATLPTMMTTTCN